MTSIPSDIAALRDAEPGPVPSVGSSLFGSRTIPRLPLLESLPQPPQPPEPPPGEPDVKPAPVIGGRLQPAELIRQTLPVYPPLARTARVQGIVLLEGTVNVNGAVENLRVVEGHPLLVGEALRAVKKWKYRPAVLNGQPVSCSVTITVRFILKGTGQ
jgi:protein TonB